MKYHIVTGTWTLYSFFSWQRLQSRVFSGMMQQALRTWIWGFSTVLLYR